jgi:aminoglycoside phosphotransferase (APT) family kinase protein
VARADAALVRRLVARRFPRWAALPVTPVRSAGTDNDLFRLGGDLVARLPRHPGAVEPLDREWHWLPWLAPRLPLAVPLPVARAEPDDGYPYPWSVYEWLEGEDLADPGRADPADVAVRLGRFVATLRRLDTAAATPSPRATLDPAVDERVHRQVRELAADGTLDGPATTAAWRAARAAPGWVGPQAWVHGDLFPSNLLGREGRLAAVVDFGLTGLGDPALDLLPAWTALPVTVRGLFRAESGVDDAAWARGRAWALALGLGAVLGYRHRNPVLAGAGLRALAEVVADPA